MTLNQFVKELGNLVQQAKVEQSMTISKGSIPNMESYHRACGRLEGMDQAVLLAKDMVNTLRDADEGDNLPEMPKTGSDNE